MNSEVYPEYPEWRKIDPPFYWKKHNLNAIGERFTEQGNSEILVIEQVPDGCVLDNAKVFTRT